MAEGRCTSNTRFGAIMREGIALSSMWPPAAAVNLGTQLNRILASDSNSAVPHRQT